VEELYIVLGCFGRRDSVESGLPEFISCGGIENRILKLSSNLESFNEIMDYFEGLRLFDKPMFDINAIRHFIYNMQERYDQKFKRLWTEKQYNLYERFIISHKSCGIYVKLIAVEPMFEPVVEPKPDKIFVKGEPEIIGKEPKFLRIVRNRK
jgi:hypothetical protein